MSQDIPGILFILNDKFNLKPNFMYRNAKGIGAVTDLGMKAQYINRFELGFSVRTGSIFSVQAIANANENFSLGYAYDTFGDDQLSGLNFKAHEIVLRYKLGTINESQQEDEPISE